MTERILHHDLETRSAVELNKAGQYVYAESPTTEVILLSWAIDEEPISTWYVLRGDPMPRGLYDAMMDPTVLLGAHNASFERIVECTSPLRPQKFLPPEVVKAIRDIKRWDCTAARAARMGLPRALGNVTQALGLTDGKDVEGSKLMMKMCKPIELDQNNLWRYHDTAEQVSRLGLYCERDVAAERGVHRMLPRLSAFEQKVWQANESLNDRGIMVDQKLLLAMTFFVVEAEADVNTRLCAATNGEVPKVTNSKKLVAWLEKSGYPPFDIRTGKASVGKQIIREMLASEEMDPLVREVLLIRQEGGKSSASKYKAVLARLNKDGRIRGAIVYCGAASTGRFSSRGAQLQNLTRGGSIKTIDQALEDILNGANVNEIREHGAPMIVASELCRPCFTATPDTWMARGDYSQIEMRVNAWSAGEHKVLKAFRDFDTIIGHDEKGKPLRGGPDAYILAAADIAGVHPSEISKDDPRRQYGKVGELACGFGGGVGAFQAFARLYGVQISDEHAEAIVKRWRESRPHVVAYWRTLENAALECMGSATGTKHHVRTGMWFTRGSLALVLRLPSGSSLIYWTPKLIETKTKTGRIRPGIEYSGEDSQTKRWSRHKAWGGIFCENSTQAIARDKMADSLVRLAEAGMRPVLTVHDEVVNQVSRALYPTPEKAAAIVSHHMTIASPWEAGLPVAVEASAGFRYVKA